jgi:hypothetical protein
MKKEFGGLEVPNIR